MEKLLVDPDNNLTVAEKIILFLKYKLIYKIIKEVYWKDVERIVYRNNLLVTDSLFKKYCKSMHMVESYDPHTTDICIYLFKPYSERYAFYSSKHHFLWKIQRYNEGRALLRKIIKTHE